MMMQRLLAAAAALSTILAVSACSGTSDPETEGMTVDVIHVPTTLFAPLYVADAKGYFEDVGISVNLQTVKTGQDAIPLAAAGRTDVVVAGFGSGLFSAVHEGLDIRVVGSMGGGGGDDSNSPTALMVAAPLVDSGEVAEIADLRGRTIAVSGGAGGGGAYQLAVILDEAGMTLNDVEVLNLGFPDMAGALSNGTAAAALPPAPFTTAMADDGVAEQFALPEAGTIASGVIYGEHFLEEDAAQLFFDALVRAQRDISADPKSEEILEILAEATGQDIEVLRSSPAYVFEENLAPVEDQLSRQQDVYREAGLFDFPDPVPMTDMVDSSFSERAAANL